MEKVIDLRSPISTETINVVERIVSGDYIQTLRNKGSFFVTLRDHVLLETKQTRIFMIFFSRQQQFRIWLITKFRNFH